MNIRKIREDLGRAKSSCQRRDFTRALGLLVSAFKELGSQNVPMDLRSDFRNALDDLCADPTFKKECPKPISYQPGKEKEIYAFLNKLYKHILGQEDKEDDEATLQRKLNLDHSIYEGKQLLSQGKVSEADAAFVKALTFVKNEYAAFAIIAKALLEAKECVRAFGHVRKGLKLRPDDKELQELAVQCQKMREEMTI